MTLLLKSNVISNVTFEVTFEVILSHFANEKKRKNSIGISNCFLVVFVKK
jgi:hypothetical protein